MILGVLYEGFNVILGPYEVPLYGSFYLLGVLFWGILIYGIL